MNHTKFSLSERLRPTEFEELVGVSDVIRNFNENQSVIIWGPPGCGKTSFARIFLSKSSLQSFSMSAVISGSQDFKNIFNIAASGTKILLHVDEIHHLNKTQQDIFLPHIENGNIVLIGTTTENPSFELRPALLSRCKVIVFKRLSLNDLNILIERCEKLLEGRLSIDSLAKKALCEMADGDGRYLVNMIQNIIDAGLNKEISVDDLSTILSQKANIYDKNGDNHYNLISALHKSIRGSDADAALYWFCRMLENGENPLYIARRLIRIATEDIGLADPNALQQAIASQQAFSFLGSTEGELALAQTVVYLATSPKSNSVYSAYNSAKNLAKKSGSVQPPKYILNAPTKLMKDLGYFKEYIYDHDTEECFSGQNYFPEGMPRPKFYFPAKRGFEREILKRLEYWENLRNKKNSQKK